MRRRGPNLAGSVPVPRARDDAASYKARTLFHFARQAIQNLAGKDAESATLKVRNYTANSRDATVIDAQQVTGSWATGSVTWNNQPTTTTTGQGQFSAAYGFSSSCAADWATWGVTPIVDAWAGGADNDGIMLNAANESNPDTWRGYRASEYVDENGNTDIPRNLALNRYAYLGKRHPELPALGDPNYAVF